MKKALCSLGAGDGADLLAVSGRTFAPYAERHGYDLHLRGELLAPELPPPWSKVPLILELLADHDLVVWIDADAAVVDPSRDIADELRDGAELYLVEHRIGANRIPNTGVLMVRGGGIAERALATVWEARHRRPHAWFEQAPLARLLGYRLPPALGTGPLAAAYRLARRRLGRDLIAAGPVRGTPLRAATELLGNEWNSIQYDPAPAPRIRHYPGEPIADRRAALERDAEAFARAAAAR
jgi:hypothetical protein